MGGRGAASPHTVWVAGDVSGRLLKATAPDSGFDDELTEAFVDETTASSSLDLVSGHEISGLVETSDVADADRNRDRFDQAPAIASSEEVQASDTPDVENSGTVTDEMLARFRAEHPIIRLGDAEAIARAWLGDTATSDQLRDLANRLLDPFQPPEAMRIVDFKSLLGGAIYPMLDHLGLRWRIISTDISSTEPLDPAAAFGMTEPTLQWVNGSSVENLYVDGMTADQFQEATGLRIDMHDKGAFVTAKRLSRLMRPYFLTGEFEPEHIDIYRLGTHETGSDQELVWDGAGVIDRRLLEQLVIPPGVSEAKRDELLKEIRRCNRVEFTLMTDKGQEKGHAIVGDNLAHDLILREDIKKEVRLTNGKVWLGINFVHAHDHMRLDIQSVINLYPFFNEETLLQRLAEEGQLFEQSVRTGDVAEVMGRIDRTTTESKIDSWPMRKAFALGGHPMWFKSWVHSVFSQGIERVLANDQKGRFPQVGGRFYVMPAQVGIVAGRAIQVSRGEIFVDEATGTAWVNDQDWVELVDSPLRYRGIDPKTGITNLPKGAGIRDILGGADNDDALWIHPFTDTADGMRKVLAWRSPNQVREYVILKPTEPSAALPWKTVEGDIEYPPGDSRQLPTRTDFTAPNYLNLVVEDKAKTPGLGIRGYSREGMNAAVQRAIANRGALGMYCNLLMVAKATFGQLPNNPPAPLEKIIDGSVKTGDDLSGVSAWCRQASQVIVDRKIPIPNYLSGRLAVGRNSPPPTLAETHWLDRLHQGAMDHCNHLRAVRDSLAEEAMPPAALLDLAFSESAARARSGRSYFQVAKRLHALYGKALVKATKMRIQAAETHGLPVSNRGAIQADYDVANQATWAEFTQYPLEDQPAILRNLILTAYMGKKQGDRMLWALGEKQPDGTAQPFWAEATFRAVQDAGALNHGYLDGKRGYLTYPGAVVQEATYRPIGITQVWYNTYVADLRTKGIRDIPSMSSIERNLAKHLKADVDQRLENGAYTDLPVQFARITDDNNPTGQARYIGKPGVWDHSGRFLGLFTPETEHRFQEGMGIIRVGFTEDGNLRCAIAIDNPPIAPSELIGPIPADS